jgi:bifunctional UDP-N-acetylglucosamine pyrophosphorylase/glucosamine-1-phosphate N-acetyltransferase
MQCEAIVLAAGLGTRMKSGVTKVLQPLAGRPMVGWAITACQEATGTTPYLIVPPDDMHIREMVDGQVQLIEQAEPLGTGHAALQAAEALSGKTDLVLITSADMPLLRATTLSKLVEAQRENHGPLTMLSMESRHPRGFGRVIRNSDGGIQEIVEEAQATPEQLEVRELNIGAYCFESAWLWKQLATLPRSAKGEYYLTDLVGVAVGDGAAVEIVSLQDPDEAIGINTLEHLAEAEAAARRRINRHWMSQGVRMIDPATTYIDATVEIGADTLVHPNTYLHGTTIIGTDCELGPGSILRDARLGDRCKVLNSVLESAELEDDVDVGPFARLRRGARLGSGVHVGNFGEIKNSSLAPGVKVGHFSYLGDATIGENANIGAGTITCNFDGRRKNPTTIGAGAFIGSDTMLVAPVTIGEGAATGAGSVVTKDVPANTLAAGVPARAIRKLKRDD